MVDISRELGEKLKSARRALTLLKKYETLPVNSEDKLAFGAALASITAEGMGNTLHTYSEDLGLTLLVSQWTQSDFPKAVLLPMPIENWDAAVAYWCVGNVNLYGRNVDSIYRDTEEIDRFIIESTVGLWGKSDPKSQLRWALAGQLREKSDILSPIDDDYDYDIFIQKMDLLKPKLLEILGYESVSQIFPGQMKEYIHENGILESVVRDLCFHIGDEDFLMQLAYKSMAKRLPTNIPIEVLKNRGELSLAQALSYYLVEQEYGPNLTYATAATLLGMNKRQEIGTHLKRARETLLKSGQKPMLSGFTRQEYLLGEAPEAIRIDLRSAENSGEEGR